MVLPLYAGIAGMRPAYGTDSNTGLWYDKFFDQYRQDWSLSKEGNEKRNWVTAICARPAGNRALLEQAGIRLSAMVYALGGEIRFFATDWRFVTGLGRNHPVENGFTWHHTLGVPFLPGSSVKGMTRAWAEAWAGADPRDIERIFGPEGEGQEKRVGSVIFFDALPAKPVKLAPDVMTPHYAEYYRQGSAVPPGDWFDPLPIPFLTVAPDQEFVFALAPRRSEDEGSRTDCRQALRWLEDALTHIGAGAKTAVGYGRFTRRPDRDEAPGCERVGRQPEPQADPDQVKADQLIAQVQALRDNDVAGRIKGYYQQWRGLDGGAVHKRRVAEAIIAKIKSAGREKKSRGEAWYQELLDSLRDS